MTGHPLVPDDFAVPAHLTTPRFRLEPLGPQHNERDHTAWMSSIGHIRATPGFPYGNWPPTDGMTPAANLGDLEAHAKDFADRSGFTYTVLDPVGGEVIGCVYVYPSRTDPEVTDVRSWVTADRAALDQPLYEAVRTWLTTSWPLGPLSYAPR